jgi:hypothetical protein
MSNFSNLQSTNPQIPHQTGNISCPCCQTMDQVQKVSAIHSAGISDLKASGTSQGHVGYYASSSNIQLNGQTQTYLSQKFAPPGKAPAKPISIKQLKITAIVTVCSFLIIMFSIMLRLILGDSKDVLNISFQFFIIGVPLITFSLPVLTITALVFLFQGSSRKTYQTRLSKWQYACSVWNQLFYCNRCHAVYDPAQPGVTAPVENIAALY